MSSARRRTCVSLAITLSSLALGGIGCGGSSAGSGSTDNSAYKSAVTNAATAWTAAAQHFAIAAQSSDVRKDLASIHAFIRANTAFANRLAAIKPPAAAESAHSALVAAPRTLSAGLATSSMSLRATLRITQQPG